MGCTDYELNLAMAPSHAGKLGLEIGRVAKVGFTVDDYGLKISDEHNIATPLQLYLDDLADYTEKPRVKLEGTTRESFVAGIVTAIAVRKNQEGL